MEGKRKMRNEFEKYAANENNPKWENIISRKSLSVGDFLIFTSFITTFSLMPAGIQLESDSVTIAVFVLYIISKFSRFYKFYPNMWLSNRLHYQLQ